MDLEHRKLFHIFCNSSWKHLAVQILIKPTGFRYVLPHLWVPEQQKITDSPSRCLQEKMLPIPRITTQVCEVVWQEGVHSCELDLQTSEILKYRATALLDLQLECISRVCRLVFFNEESLVLLLLSFQGPNYPTWQGTTQDVRHSEHNSNVTCILKSCPGTYLKHYTIQLTIFYTVVDPDGVTTYLIEQQLV